MKERKAITAEVAGRYQRETRKRRASSSMNSQPSRATTAPTPLTFDQPGKEGLPETKPEL